MMLAQLVMTNVNLNQASLNSDSNQVLTKLLNPIFKFEVASFELSELSQDRLATQLIASNNVSITKLDSSKFTWDYHFIQPGSSFSSDMYNYQSTYIFGDKNKNFYRAPDNANRYVSLDNEHSQYVGSNGNEIINLDGESIVPFYVRAGSGDDVIKISSSLFKTSQAVVNIIGGGGKNTYVIDVADGRTSLPGQIHIWDFDPNKDTIYFNTYGSYAALNIQETKRTLSSSPYKIAAIWPDSTVSLSKVYKKSFFWNLFFPSYSSYSAA
jgi:hypothetical protein